MNSRELADIKKRHQSATGYITSRGVEYRCDGCSELKPNYSTPCDVDILLRYIAENCR